MPHRYPERKSWGGVVIFKGHMMRANSSLALLLKEQKQTQVSIDNIVNAIERGIVSNATAKRLKELEERQQELERLVLIEQSKSAVKLTEQDIRRFYEQALRQEAKMLINYLIDKIVLYDDRMEIYFNSPLKADGPDESRGFCFYKNTVSCYAFSHAQITPQQRMEVRIYIG